MVIHKLRVKGWRAWADFTLELQPRLNLICGPNESGKSSLQEAMLAALTQGARPGGRHRLHSVKPWGSTKTATEVELTFHHGEAEWFVKRVFFGKGCELRKQGKVVAREASVLTELTEVVGNAGLTALLSTQGERNLAPIPAALRPHLSTTEAISPGLPWLETTLDELSKQYWTEKRSQPRELLKAAGDARLEAERVLHELRKNLADVDRASQEIGMLDLDLEALRGRERELEARLEREQEALQTERRELALQVQELVTWQQDNQRFQHQLAAELARQSEHDQRVAALRERMGPTPDRGEIEALQHRLRYCEAWLAELLTRTLTDLRAPAPEALQALEGLLERRARLTELLERLSQLASAQAELERRQQEASSFQGTVAELEERLRRQRELVEEHQRERERQAELGREAEHLTQVMAKCEEQRQVVLELHAAHLAYVDEVQQSERGLGEEPSRESLDALRGRARSCQVMAWRTEREQLRSQPLPDVAALEALEERVKRLREAQELAQAVLDPGELEKEVEELRAAHVLAAERRAMAEELQPLQEGVKRWQGLMPTLRQRHRESLEYEERRAELKARMGEKPDRGAPDELRARLRAVEAREQQLRKQEIEALKVPARSRLDEADVAVKTCQAALELAQKSGRGAQMALLGLVVGVALGFAAYKVVGAAVAGLVGAVIGFVLGGNAGAVKAAQVAFEESSARLKSLLADHGLDSVDAARNRLEHRAILEAGLRSLPVPDSMPDLTTAEVRRELQELPARIEEAEARLREDTQRYEKHEKELEELLQSNPEAGVEACREQLEAVARTFPEALRPSIPRVGEDGELALALARIAELAGAPPLEEARRMEAEAKSRLDAASERLQVSRGEAKGRAKALRDKLKLEAGLTEEGIPARLAELEAQLPEGGSAAAREQVASVRTRLEALEREGFDDADLDPEGLEGLGLDELRTLLKATQAEVEVAEETWKKASLEYQSRSKEHMALVARNPEGALQQAVEQLRKLGMAVPAEGWLAAVQAGDPSLALQRQDVTVRLDELTARLTAEDPRPHFEELQRMLADATSETTQKAGGQGLQAGQVEQQWEEVKRAAAALDVAPGDVEAMTAACREALEEAEARSAALFTEFGSEDVEELRARSLRAAELSARLESQPACAPERLAELRAACESCASVEALTEEALVKERQELEARVARVEKAWEGANRAFAEQQGELERLLAGDPEEAVRTVRGELERLASEHADEASVLSKLGQAQQRVAAIDQLLKSEGGGESGYEQALGALKALRAEAGELRSRSDTLLGTIQSERHIYHHQTRAEEAYRRADAEWREVLLEAEAIQLLKDYIAEAKEALEADLVGPLRSRLDTHLHRLTQGRYHGVDLAPDFTAEQLAGAGALKAPIGDLSVGTQEQLAFLSRVSLAQLLSEQERMVVIFDDNLVHTDGVRLEIASEILLECAETCQVLLFTCHPERFGRLQEVAHRVELPTLVGV